MAEEAVLQEKSIDDIFKEAENPEKLPSQIDDMGKETANDDVDEQPEEEEEEDEQTSEEQETEEDEEFEETPPEDTSDESDDPDDDDDTDEEEEPTKKDLIDKDVAEPLKELYPDADLSDPESTGDVINDLVQTKKGSSEIFGLLQGSDDLQQLARTMHNEGMDFLPALHKTFDVEEAVQTIKEEDPKKYEEIVESRLKRKQEQEKQQERIKEFNSNLEDSAQNLEKFVEKNDLNEDKKKKFESTVEQIVSDAALKGKLTMDTLETLRKGILFDDAVEEAIEEGKVKGRNDQIQKKKNKKKGDGLPNTRSTGTKPSGKQKSNNIFDAAMNDPASGQRLSDYK